MKIHPTVVNFSIQTPTKLSELNFSFIKELSWCPKYPSKLDVCKMRLHISLPYAFFYKSCFTILRGDGDGDGDTDTTTKENKTKPPTFSRDFDFSLCRSDCMLQRIIKKKITGLDTYF